RQLARIDQLRPRVSARGGDRSVQNCVPGPAGEMGELYSRAIIEKTGIESKLGLITAFGAEVGIALRSRRDRGRSVGTRCGYEVRNRRVRKRRLTRLSICGAQLQGVHERQSIKRLLAHDPRCADLRVIDPLEVG